jgi:hypothetical protein
MKPHVQILAECSLVPRVLKALLAVFAAVISATALVGFALGDTLELRTGEVVQGRFVGGSPLNIRFVVDGKEQIFPTKDVLNIGFDNQNDATSVPTPAPVPSPEAGPPSNSSTAAAASSVSTVQPADRPEAAATRPPTADLPDAPAANLSRPPTPRQPALQSQAGTVPAGTSLMVRMIDGVDSSTSRVGDPFQATLDSDLVAGDTVVARRGSDVFGQLSQAKSAGKISGGAQLTLELTGIRINGNMVALDSTTYDLASKGRGGQSAERIGGGAALGAIIGAIAGGGKGAAIGAGAGAGAGTAVQVLTHGEQVRVPSETLLEFKLEQDLTVPPPGDSN